VSKKILLLLCSALFAISLAACDKKGPLEEAGEKADDTMENMGDKMEEAADEAEDAMEEMGDKMEGDADH
jgi:predicted small lipoprotein YifL